MLDVLGFGESSVDYVYTVAALPPPGASKLPIASHYTAVGGQVATTIAACAALGLDAGYLGPVGDDDDGRRVREALQDRDVDLSRLVVRGAGTRYAVILLDGSTGERVVLWERDPRLDLAPNDVRPGMVAAARVVHLDATDEATSIRLARLAQAAGAVVTCDVDSVSDRTPEFLACVTVPILAANVPRELTGISDVEGALRAMRATHPGLLCVTLGENGSAALDGNHFVHAQAVSVRAVDTTGAGDVFRAGVIYGLLHAWPAERMLRFANAAGALSCTRQGAMNSVPSPSEVEAHLR